MSTTFDVKEMSCGNCVKHVTKAVQAVAAGRGGESGPRHGQGRSDALAERPGRARENHHRSGLSGAARAIDGAGGLSLRSRFVRR